MSFVKNVAKSLGYAAPAYTANKLNNIYALSFGASKTFREQRDFFKSTIDELKQESYLPKLGKDIKSAFKDLKAGKIYQEETLDDMGFGFEGSEISFGDESPSDQPSASVSSSNSSVGSEAAALTIASAVATSGNSQARVTAKSTQVLAAGLSAVSAGIDTIAQFNAHRTSHFYDTSIELQSQTVGNLVAIKTLLEEQRTERIKYFNGAKSSKAASSLNGMYNFDGSLNLDSYIKTKITEVKGFTGKDSLFGMIAMSYSKPLNAITEAIIDKVIPNLVQKSLSRLNDSLGQFTGNMVMMFNDMRNSKSDFMRAIGSIFGVDSYARTQVSMSQYHKGAVPFDGMVRKSIVDVIPTLLSKILSAVKSQKTYNENANIDDLVFDHEQGIFRKKSDILKEYKSRRDSIVNGSQYLSSDLDTVKRNAMNSKLDSFKKAKLDQKAIVEKMQSFEQEMNSTLSKMIENGSGFFRKLSSNATDMEKHLFEQFSKMSNYEKSQFNSEIRRRQQQLVGFSAGISGGIEGTGTSATISALLDNDSMTSAEKIKASKLRADKFRKLAEAEIIKNGSISINGKTFSVGKNKLGRAAAPSISDKDIEHFASLQEKASSGFSSIEDFEKSFASKEKTRATNKLDASKSRTGSFIDKLTSHVNAVFFGREDDASFKLGKIGSFARFGIFGNVKNFFFGKGEDLGKTSFDKYGLFGTVKKQFMERFLNPMKSYLFGEKDADGNVTKKGLFGDIRTWFSEKLFNPMKSYLFGEKDADGNVTKKGLFGDIRTWFSEKLFNPMKDFITNKIMNPMKSYLFGEKDADGNVTKKGLFNSVQQWFSEQITSPLKKIYKEQIAAPLKTFLFGEKDADGKLIKNGLFGSLRTSIENSIVNPIKKWWTGSEQDGKIGFKNTLKTFWTKFSDNVKEHMIKPMKFFFFGEKDADGNRVKHGLFSSLYDNVILGFKKHFFPNSGNAADNRPFLERLFDSTKKFLFGKADPSVEGSKDGVLRRLWNPVQTFFVGDSSRDSKSFLKLGLFGHVKKFFVGEDGEGGLFKTISEKVWQPFSQFLFGNEENSKVGLFQKFDNFMTNKVYPKMQEFLTNFWQKFDDKILAPFKTFVNDQLWQPFKATVTDLYDRTKTFFVKEVFEPLKGTLAPFTTEIKYQFNRFRTWITTDLWNGIKNGASVVDGMFGDAFGKKFSVIMKENVLDPIKKVLNDVKEMLFKVFKEVLKVPVNFIKESAGKLRERHAKLGILPNGTVDPSKAMGNEGFFGKILNSFKKGGSASSIPDAMSTTLEAKLKAEPIEEHKVSLLGSIKRHLSDLKNSFKTKDMAGVKSMKSMELTAANTASNLSVATKVKRFLESNIAGVGRNISRITRMLGEFFNIKNLKGMVDGKNVDKKSFFGRLMNFITSPISTAIELIGNASKQLLKGATSLLSLPFKLVKTVAETTMNIVEGVSRGIKGIMGGLMEGMGKFIGATVSLTSTLLKNAATITSTVVNILGEVTAEAVRVTGRVFTHILEGSIKILDGLASVTGKVISGMVDLSVVIAEKVIPAMFRLVTSIIGGVANLVGSGLRTIGNMLGFGKGKDGTGFGIGSRHIIVDDILHNSDALTTRMANDIHALRNKFAKGKLSASLEGKASSSLTTFSEIAADKANKLKEMVESKYKKASLKAQMGTHKILETFHDGWKWFIDLLKPIGAAMLSFGGTIGKMLGGGWLASKIGDLIKWTGLTPILSKFFTPIIGYLASTKVGQMLGKTSIGKKLFSKVGVDAAEIGTKTKVAEAIAERAVAPTAIKPTMMGKLKSGAGKAFGSVKDLGKGALSKGIGSRVGKGVGIAAITSLVGGMAVDSFTDAGSAANDTLSGAVNGASYGAMIGSVFPVVGTAIGAAAGGVIGGVIGGFDHAKKWIEDTFSPALLSATEWLDNIPKRMTEWADSLPVKIEGFANSITDGILNFISNPVDNIANAVSSLVSGEDVAEPESPSLLGAFFRAFGRAFGAIVKNLPKIGMAIVTGIAKLGTGIVIGLGGAIRKGVDKLVASISDTLDYAISYLKVKSQFWLSDDEQATKIAEERDRISNERNTQNEVDRQTASTFENAKKSTFSTLDKWSDSALGWAEEKLGIDRSAKAVAPRKEYENTKAAVKAAGAPTLIDAATIAKTRQDPRYAISLAAQQVGVPADSLLKLAYVESNLDPYARAKTSSAGGLFQFLDETWKSVLATHGAKYGIPKNASKFDPYANAVMGAAFYKQNMNEIKSVKPNPSVTDVYMAHFLGAGGARRFLKQLTINPAGDPLGTNAVDRAQADANASIFFANGKRVTLGGVYDNFAKKLGYSGSYPQVPYTGDGLSSSEYGQDSTTTTPSGFAKTANDKAKLALIIANYNRTRGIPSNSPAISKPIEAKKINSLNLGQQPTAAGSATMIPSQPVVVKDDFNNTFSSNFSQGKSTTIDNGKTGIDLIADNSSKQLLATEVQNKLLAEILGSVKNQGSHFKKMADATSKSKSKGELASLNTNNFFNGTQASQTAAYSYPPEIASLMTGGFPAS